jgi:hypothetical protein
VKQWLLLLLLLLLLHQQLLVAVHPLLKRLLLKQQLKKRKKTTVRALKGSDHSSDKTVNKAKKNCTSVSKLFVRMPDSRK